MREKGILEYAIGTFFLDFSREREWMGKEFFRCSGGGQTDIFAATGPVASVVERIAAALWGQG